MGEFGRVWESWESFGKVSESFAEFSRVWESLREFGRVLTEFGIVVKFGLSSFNKFPIEEFFNIRSFVV